MSKTESLAAGTPDDPHAAIAPVSGGGGAARQGSDSPLSDTSADVPAMAAASAGATASAAGQHHHAGALASAIRVVSGMTFLSRLGGLLRDVLVARVFGDTALGSAFTAGFAIPNMFRRLFGEGALSAAFIPAYASAEKKDPEEARRLASITVFALCLFTSLLTVAAELALLVALAVLPANADRDLSIRLIMVMLPFMPFICVTAILGGMLQVHGKFGPAASGPLVLNGFIVVVGLYHLWKGSYGDPTTAYAIGIATVLSGVTQAAWFAILLRPFVRWTRDWDSARPAARRMFMRMIPVLVGLGTLQLNTFMDTLIAMWPTWFGPSVLGHNYPLDKASAIILASAQRLYQFPLGVFGIAVATAVFPMLSRDADEPERFVQTLRRGVRLSLFIGVPASLGLALVSGDLVHVLYRFDAKGFSAEGIERTIAVVWGHAGAIWAYSLNHVFTRAFYARHDTRRPMKVAVSMVVLNFLGNVILIWPLREAGLAWSTSVCAVIQCVILGFMCRRRLSGPIFDGQTTLGVAKVALTALLMAASVYGMRLTMPAAAGWSGHALHAGVATAVGAMSYGLFSLLLRVPELRWLADRRRAAPARRDNDGVPEAID